MAKVSKKTKRKIRTFNSRGKLTIRALILFVFIFAGTAGWMVWHSFAAASTGTLNGLVATNCDPAATDQAGELFYNTRNSSGLWQPMVGNANCQGQALLPLHDGHQGVANATPDGQLVLVESANGTLRKSSSAEPGKGLGIDLDLYNRKTGQVSHLTNSKLENRKGIIWSKINTNATKVAWSQMRLTPLQYNVINEPFGVWTLHVADLQQNSDGTYKLANERTWEHPTEPGFIETYGWVPDTNNIIFANDSGSRNPASWWLGTQLWTIPDTLPSGTNQRVRVSQPFQDPTWCASYSWCANKYTQSSPYHEFANFNGDGYVYTSIKRDTSGGLDMWKMRIDGSDRQRVTWFNGQPNGKGIYSQVSGWPAPKYSVVLGGMAWINGSWVIGVTSDSATSIDAYRITP
jgi:hypothetical protein